MYDGEEGERGDGVKEGGREMERGDKVLNVEGWEKREGRERKGSEGGGRETERKGVGWEEV